MIFEGRIVISAVMLALFAGMVGYAFTFPPAARFLPLVIGVPGLLFCLAQLALEIGAGRSEIRPREERRREIAMFAWLLGFIAAILLFGFVVAGPLLIAAYLYFDWNERPLVVIGAAAVAFGVFYGIFERALELRLFDGFVWRWFAG